MELHVLREWVDENDDLGLHEIYRFAGDLREVLPDGPAELVSHVFAVLDSEFSLELVLSFLNRSGQLDPDKKSLILVIPKLNRSLVQERLQRLEMSLTKEAFFTFSRSPLQLPKDLSRHWKGCVMDQDAFNMSMRKFLKQVGVTSQQQIEKTVRESDLKGRKTLKVKMVLTAEGTGLAHVVEGEIDLG